MQRRLGDRAEVAPAARRTTDPTHLLRAMLTGLPGLIGYWDAELRNHIANDAYVEYFGLTPEQIKGRHIREVVGEELFELNRPFIEAVLRGEPQLFDRTIIDTTGTPRYTQASYVPDVADGEVVGFFVMVTDITARREAELMAVTSEERLRWHAFHDPLTGLPNRALLLERLHNAVERELHPHDHTALLFVDLDRFKMINDSLGHAAGDELLVEVASRLKLVVRDTDTVSRFGGDEFVILAEHVGDLADATLLAQRIRRELARPIDLSGGRTVVTASIGVALDDGRGGDGLLRAADDALYRAKTAGRDRHQVFDDALRSEATRRRVVERALRRALDDDHGVTVHYQPIIDLSTGQLVSAEALVRLRGSDGSLQPPSDFIPIAEDTGLVVEIGAMVLDRACGQLRAWRDEHPLTAPLRIAANVAARQLSTHGFVDIVRSALTRHRLEPSDLTLELTESTIIGADHTAVQTVADLHELGITLAVDDFGTGYSSLSYLKRFPIDSIKVDREFIQGLDTDASDTEIVKAVVSLGRSLGLTTTAEGIETPRQLEALRNLGCDHGQGYLWSKAVPGDELLASVQADLAVWAGAH